MKTELPAALAHIFERKAHPFHMWDGIQSIAAGLEDILSPQSVSAVRSVSSAMHPTAPVHLLGCGTSYFAAIAIAHAIRHIADREAYPWQAFEFLAYPPRSIQNSSVVGISHTGGTPPVVQAVDLARKMGACTVGYTDEIPSALTRSCEWVVPGTLGIEPALPKTRSYPGTLMRGYLQAVELAHLNGKDTQSWTAALYRAPDICRRVVAEVEAQARDLAGRWCLSRRIVVSGGGPQHATAMEGALKLTEAASINAAPWEIEEAVHGTWASTTEDDLVILAAVDGPSYAGCVRLAGGMKAIGSKVWVITNRAWTGVKVDAVTFLPKGEPEMFMPLYAILPIYQFAYFAALGKHLSPDAMQMSDPRFLEARKLMRSSLL